LKSCFFSQLSGAKEIVSFQHPRESPARIFYRRQVEARGAHVIQQYHSLAEAIAGGPLPDCAAALPHDQQAEASIAKKISGLGKDLVILNPGAGWGSKRWPAERYG
jgi:heptosyltransferase-1